MKLIMLYDTVDIDAASSVELVFREDFSAEIRKFFAEELPAKDIVDCDSDEFLDAFFEFLLDCKVTKKEQSVLNMLRILNSASDEYFYNLIDGRDYDKKASNDIIYVDDINKEIYRNVKDDVWRDYEQSRAFLVFLAVLLVNGELRLVKRKLLRTLPVLTEWNNLIHLLRTI